MSAGSNWLKGFLCEIRQMPPEIKKLISNIAASFQGKYESLASSAGGINVFLSIPRQEKKFLSEDEAIAFCSIGKTSFRHAVALKLIPYCIFPGSSKKLFHREDLERAVRSNRKQGLQSDRLLK